MADEKQEGHESGAAAQSGGGSKLVPLLIGVNTLVTIAMTVVLFLSFQKENLTPLMYVCDYGNGNVALGKLLLDKGAHIDATNDVRLYNCVYVCVI